MASTSFTSRKPITARCKRLVPKRCGGEKVSDRQERVPGWNQARLSSATVVVQGAGGIGSTVCRTLVRQGVGVLHACDPNVVQPSNLSRQEYAAEDVFKPKACQLVRSLAEVGVMGTIMTGYPLYFREFLKVYRGPHPDVVVSGVDNNAARAEAAQWSRALRMPLVCAGIAADAGSAYVFVQEPDKACLGCYLGTHLLTGGAACPGIPAVVDIVLVLAGFVSYAVTSLLMQRERSWNLTRFFLASGQGESHVVAIHPHCPLCKGKGA